VARDGRTLPFHLQYDHVLRMPKQTRRQELIILSWEDPRLEIAADVARTAVKPRTQPRLLVKKGATFSATQNTRCHNLRYILTIVLSIFKFEHLVELLRRPLDSETRHKQYKPENQSNFVDFHSGVPEDKGNRLPPERDKVNFLFFLWHNGDAALTLYCLQKGLHTVASLCQRRQHQALSYGNTNFQIIYCCKVEGTQSRLMHESCVLSSRVIPLPPIHAEEHRRRRYRGRGNQRQT
jgi:hypothetical protein